MKNKKIVSLGLALSLAISPLNCSSVFASTPTSAKINANAKIENSEDYKLLKEKLEKCMADQAKLEKQLEDAKKKNKKEKKNTGEAEMYSNTALKITDKVIDCLIFFKVKLPLIIFGSIVGFSTVGLILAELFK